MFSAIRNTLLFLLSSLAASAQPGCPPAPRFDFGYTQDACNPHQVRFLAAPPAGSSVDWSFGDGQSVLGQLTPTNTYGTYGLYRVKLRLHFGAGCMDSTEKTIAVQNIADPALLAARDTALCAGDALLLQAPAGLQAWCWTAAPAAPVPNGLSGSVTPSVSTTYFLTGQRIGTNLVTNPDFSQGNTGFSSAYISTTSNDNEGQFLVGTTPTSWNVGMYACSDRSGNAGNMMMVNGSPVSGAMVWQEHVSVTPNTQYRFAVWITSLHPTNPARLRFAINGVVVGDDIDPGGNACNWSQFATSWNSGAATTAVLTIVNNNVILQGNDFALDDLFFGEFDQRYDSVRVLVGPRPQEPFGNDTLVCAGTFPMLDAGNAGAQFTWQDGSVTQQHAVSAPGLYSVIISNAGCTVRDSIRVDTIPINLQLPPTLVRFCSGDSVQLEAGGGLSYQWMKTGQLLGSGPSLSIRPRAAASVELRITTRCGDRGPFHVLVQPKEAGQMFLPNAFTPGTDGRNDRFRPLVEGILEYYSFSVYNRWGECVFASGIQGAGWDGTFKGTPQPGGVYVYLVHAGDGCSAPYQRKGTVLLIR